MSALAPAAMPNSGSFSRMSGPIRDQTSGIGLSLPAVCGGRFPAFSALVTGTAPAAGAAGGGFKRPSGQ
jgi:hypothetical protein